MTISPGRLEERIKGIQQHLDEHSETVAKANESLNSLLDARQSETASSIDGLRDDIQKNYVRIERFSPIEKVVYGLVFVVLMSVAGVLVMMVVNKPT